MIGDKTIFFQPSFGNRPSRIVGRDSELSSVIAGLREPPGARERCILILGQRGMGKTAMLLEIAERAVSEGFIVARVTAHEEMPSAIIDQFQLNGSRFFAEERKLTGINAGAFGFSFGLDLSEPSVKQYGFRAKMSLMCDRLEEKGKGALIIIDEAHSSSAMREVAASYQELVGDGRNIAITMAGLPQAVSSILNDEVLTFLNRAEKIDLGAISVSSVEAYFDYAFSSMGIKYTDKIINEAAEKTQGFPYLMQLMGYYLTRFSEPSGTINENVLKKAEESSRRDLEDNVFKPIMAPLSDNDRLFLRAMAALGDAVSIDRLKEELGAKASSVQTYRKRMLEAGIIEAPRRGELVFAIPHLREYLAG